MRLSGILTLLGLFYLLPAGAQVYRDTSFVPPLTDISPFFAQNKLYSSRLDSIRKIVPLPYNEAVQKYIDIYASRKAQIGEVLGLAEYYFPIFEQSLKEYGIPQEIKYLSVVESALNPNAVSRSGATGLWQFMYTTAKGYHLEMSKFVDDRKNPVSASRAAAAYFRDAFNELGDWLLAIAAYNCGKGAVTRAIERAGGKTDFWEIRPFLPEQTQNYVPAFIATTYIMTFFKAHDILPTAPGFPTSTEMIEVSSEITMEGLAAAAKTDLKHILALNPSYKKHTIYGSATAPQQVIIPAVRDNTTYGALYALLNHEITTDVAASGSTGTGIIYHRVAKGETIAAIADKYAVDVQDLRVWNKLASLDVATGQTLKVGAEIVRQNKTTERSAKYKVRPGDTLSAIAEKFGQTIASLKSINKLRSSVLQPGMVLKVKG